MMISFAGKHTQPKRLKPPLANQWQKLPSNEDSVMRTQANRTLWIVAFTCVSLNGIQAAANEKDPLAEHFAPPELILQHRDELGLTTEQATAIKEEAKAAQATLPRLQEALQEEVHKLNDLLGQATASESSVIEQLDQVLDREREIKRLHISLLYRIRIQLTPEQRAELKQVKAATMAERQQIMERVQRKVHRLQQIVEQRTQAGRPPREAAELIETFQDLIERKRIKAAEAVLDKALEVLEPVSKPSADRR